MNRKSFKISFKHALKLFALLLLPALTAFSAIPVLPAKTAVVCTCTPPSPVRTGQSAGSNTYSWSPVSGASKYAVWYVRKSDGYTSSIFQTTAMSFTFSGLSAGDYDFYFATVCGGAELSDYIIIEDVVI